MKVYLTGINSIKNPKRTYHENETQNLKEQLKKFNNERDSIKEETLSKEEINEENNDFSKNNKYKRNSKNNNLLNEIKKTNNYLTIDDTRKKKRNTYFYNDKDYKKYKKIQIENKKNKEIITEQLKDDFLDYIMSKEPKYADFDKISEDLQKQIYENYKIYNKNLLEIEKKKQTLNDVLKKLEKTLIDNYFISDSSMIQKKMEEIEKTKYDILTKEQEYASYKKIHEDLYNQNFLIKRKVLDNIDIDRMNEEYHDQYKLLQIHAIVQVSKKQDSLNQIDEYYKNLLDEHDKEYKAKNKILKDLKIEIEVFKEDEKEFIHKLRKIKAKRNELKSLIKERQKKNLTYNEILIKYAKKNQRSFISMNKIFRSVNANNLDDVLLDVNSINCKFNNLKTLIMKSNLDISNLNSIYSKLSKNLENINKQINTNKNKKTKTFTDIEQDKIIKIKNYLQKEKEEQNEIKEIIEQKIAIFQNGIAFIFHKIKSLVFNIKFLKNFISPKMFQIIQKYKQQQYRLNYDVINKKFFKQFSFLFFQYCNIVFYLSLRMLCSGITIQQKKNRNDVIKVKVDKKQYLNIYEEKVKKALKDYKHRLELKKEKQKEINEKSKQREIQKKIENQIIDENKSLNQIQMYHKFIEYLRAKEDKKNSSKSNKHSFGANKANNSKKNSFFFTGIDSAKYSQSNPLESSSSSSSSNSYGGNTTSQIGLKKKENKKIIPFIKKEEFLELNKNKLINIFSKYQNNLAKKYEKNLYSKKIKGVLKRSISTLSPKMLNYKYSQSNPYYTFQKKHKKPSKIKSKNKKIFCSFDENYEYDEDDIDFNQNKEFEIGHGRKKEKKNYITFLKLNKDIANLYKKKSDLQKLQMAYFGGRFLNTKINDEIFYSKNNLDDIVDNYRKQEPGQFKINKKLRLKNYRKKSVYQISANKSMKDKVSHPWKRKIKDNYFNSNNEKINSNHNYTYVKPKYLDYKRKSIKRSKSKSFRANKIVFTPFSKTYNRTNMFSPNNLYRKGIE